MDTDAEIRRLREENERLRRFVLALAERIAAASEVLSRVAERRKRPKQRCWMAERLYGRRCDS